MTLSLNQTLKDEHLNEICYRPGTPH